MQPDPTSASQKLQPPVTLSPNTDAQETSRPIHPEVRPHAFVIMPFGKKKGADGSLYDFK
jgi:hypothetical protein